MISQLCIESWTIRLSENIKRKELSSLSPIFHSEVEVTIDVCDRLREDPASIFLPRVKQNECRVGNDEESTDNCYYASTNAWLSVFAVVVKLCLVFTDRDKFEGSFK